MWVEKGVALPPGRTHNTRSSGQGSFSARLRRGQAVVAVLARLSVFYEMGWVSAVFF